MGQLLCARPSVRNLTTHSRSTHSMTRRVGYYSPRFTEKEPRCWEFTQQARFSLLEHDRYFISDPFDPRSCYLGGWICKPKFQRGPQQLHLSLFHSSLPHSGTPTPPSSDPVSCSCWSSIVYREAFHSHLFSPSTMLLLPTLLLILFFPQLPPTPNSANTMRTFSESSEHYAYIITSPSGKWGRGGGFEAFTKVF